MKKELLMLFFCLNVLPMEVKATETEETTGYIETNLIFQANDKLEQVEGRTITFSLYKGDKLLGNALLSQPVTAIAGYPISVIPVLGDNDRILSYKITVTGLEQGDYVISLTGKFHKDYKSEVISIGDVAKQLNISTQSTDFTYGDLNGDNLVDEKDLSGIQYHIQNKNHEYDLTGDGIVDITDLALVKMNLSATESSVLLETHYVNLQDLVDVDEMVSTWGDLGTVFGDISTLFLSGNTETVSIHPVDGEISEEIPLSFPIILEEPQEMSQILITSTTEEGALQEGFVEVVYENSEGEEVAEIISYATEITSENARTSSENQENVVIISLGERVVVKTITVTVTKTDGDAYAVLKEVNFVKDLVPEDPTASNGIVGNVVATAGDEKVSLTWSNVNNISGYRIYYGTSRGKYTSTLNTTGLSATISGLENFTNYYFSVASTHDDWTSGYSTEVSAQPVPSSKPGATTFLEINPFDMGASLRWQNNSKASSYNIYYKKTEDSAYVLGGTTSNTTLLMGDLENGVEYSFYITGVNGIGEGTASNILTVIPEKENLDGPVLPTYGRIPTSSIIEIEMQDPSNVKSSLYPNGFDLSFVADDDYSTDWVADLWYKSSSISFTLEQAYDMSYLAYVGRLEGSYRSSLSYATVNIWTDEDDLDGSPSITYTDHSVQYTNSLGESYGIVDFPRSNVVKIQVMMAQWNGSPTNVSLSEIAFFEHNPIDDDISALFSNHTYTELETFVTEKRIASLRARVEEMDDYIINRDILTRELDMAEAILNYSPLSTMIISEFDSIDSSKDDPAMSNISPLGVLGYAGEQITVYADIPEGESIEIVPSQYYSEAFEHLGSGIKLENGRNIITVEQLTTINVTKGGPLYYRYTGDKGDEISLNVESRYNSSGRNDIVSMPVLSLYGLFEMTETEIKAKIEKYLEELEVFVNVSRNTLSLNPSNSTEISLRNVLLSLPASEVYNGLSGYDSSEEQIEGLYQNILAWEELLMVCNIAYGLDDYENPREGRQNIRYMRMSDTAFMYAGGNHIGIQYGSVAALMKGKPTSVTGAGNDNSLFGWGIAHEIGHNLDRLGRVEITNNIYSLLAQTYDGVESYGSSRLSGQYTEIYNKVTSGNQGIANNVFVQLGMYWQLQQAYCGENPLEFYNLVNKSYKYGENSSHSGDVRFAVAVSHIVEKDLSAFFTAWGVILTDAARSEMSQYPEETRKIQYFNDDSREYRLTGGTGISSTVAYVLSAVPSSENIKEVNLVFQNNYNVSDLLGFEFYRNGKLIGFSTTGYFTDSLGSLNNTALEYSVIAVDRLGNDVGEAVYASELRIEYDNFVDSSTYTVSQVGNSLKFTFKESTVLSGLVFYEESDNISFSVEVVSGSGDRMTVKSDKIANSDGKSLHYFNKQNVPSSDTRIGVYDVTELYVTGINSAENISFLSYIGDNIQFMEQPVGVLGADFDTGDGIIEEGTIIVMGEYLGDPYFSEVTLMGKFAHSHGVDQDIEYEERNFSGTTYLIAYDTETVSTISDGLFIFVPDIQSEEELQGGDHETCTHLSLFPADLKAILERTSDTGNYQTSDTVWVSVPTEDSMPLVFIE